MHKRIVAGLTALSISVIACEPVFAIGWREIFWIFILAAVLIGPSVYRFLRKLEEYRKRKDK